MLGKLYSIKLFNCLMNKHRDTLWVVQVSWAYSMYFLGHLLYVYQQNAFLTWTINSVHRKDSLSTYLAQVTQWKPL